MPLSLPDPDRARLARAQLDLVVLQVRHERNLASIDPKRALEVHADLSSRYPSIEDVSAQEVSVVAGPGGIAPMNSEVSRGWRFRSADEKWTVVLMPDFFSLETTAYEEWEDFNDRASELTSSVQAHLSPSIETRLGLRYIDRLTEPRAASPDGWEPYIHPSLLGPLVHPDFGGAIEQVQQVVRIDAGDGCQVLLRHGCGQEDSDAWVYLLDLDCSMARSRPFDAAGVLGGIDEIHTVALQVFQAAVTPKLLSYLRGDD
jgi:uncharacterized protein (TIGR04255 family)